MIHVSWHLNSRTDGGFVFVKAEMPNPPIIPKPKPMMTGLAHFGPFGDLSPVYCAASDWFGDDV